MTGRPELTKLDRDLRKRAADLTPEQARAVIRTYYQEQQRRIGASHQARQLARVEEPHDLLDWISAQEAVIEQEIYKALRYFAAATTAGEWALGICGIGPVIAAGMVAYVDVEKAKTAGAVWRYFGYEPGQRRVKGQKSNWNPTAKQILFHAGSSFVRQSPEKSYYRRVYDERKAYEIAKNEAGDYESQARVKTYTAAEAKTWAERGMLTPGHIEARVRRYIAKLFASHYHMMAYREHYGCEPPLPYPIAHQGHVHFVPPEDAY